MSQVCLRHNRFVRERNRRAFLRFRPRSLPLLGMVGESMAGGVTALRCEVARALAPVSPRGSAPRLELLRRRRAASPFALCEIMASAESTGNVSVFCAETIVAEFSAHVEVKGRGRVRSARRIYERADRTNCSLITSPFGLVCHMSGVTSAALRKLSLQLSRG